MKPHRRPRFHPTLNRRSWLRLSGLAALTCTLALPGALAWAQSTNPVSPASPVAAEKTQRSKKPAPKTAQRRASKAKTKAKAKAKAPAKPKLDPKDPAFARKVLDRVDDVHRGDQSHAIMSMEVKTSHWQRTVQMESWSRGKSYSLVRILEPKRERGTATLKNKDQLFSYLPKTGRTIKITGGMMGGSWMGSHFSNDDLVRETRMADSYVARLSFSGPREGQAVYQFELRAKPSAPVVWDKVVVVVRSLDLQPLRIDYFDEDGKNKRRLVFSGHRKVGDRTLPITMIMYPLDKKGEYTKIQYKAVDFAPKLDPKLFSLQHLKSL